MEAIRWQDKLERIRQSSSKDGCDSYNQWRKKQLRE